MRVLFGLLLALCIVHSGLCCGKNRKKPGKPGPNNPPGCAGAVNCLVGDNVQTNPYTPGGDSPGDCSQLKCNLDDSSSCSWTNAQPPADQLNWVSASGPGQPEKLQKTFGNTASPSGNYFLTASDVAGSSSQTAELYSAPITCANSDITVKVKHWQSQGIRIQVCDVKDPAGTPEHCQDLPGASGQTDTVTIPKGQNVRAVIQATGFQAAQGSVAIVDDIEVQCDPCPSTTPSPTASPTPAPTPSPAKPPCKEIVCNFESGNPCSYSTASGGGNAADPFGVHSAPYQNRLTGVPKAGEGQKFAAAYLKKQGEKSTLQTNANFDNDYVVRFNYYKATEGVNLRACCDDESNCPYGATPSVQTSDYRSWKTASIMCKSGTKKVIFICENLKGVSEGACGIDNIQLLQPSGGSPDDASQSACVGQS